MRTASGPVNIAVIIVVHLKLRRIGKDALKVRLRRGSHPPIMRRKSWPSCVKAQDIFGGATVCAKPELPGVTAEPLRKR